MSFHKGRAFRRRCLSTVGSNPLLETLEPRSLLAAAPSGLAAIAGFDQLPYLASDRLAGGQSSYDRSGGNKDWGNFIRVDGNGDHVILDERGPGIVNRLWFTGVNDTARIKMWFNGESTPRVNLRLVDLFGGSDARFPAPLVAGPLASSGGFVSYLPMPYSSSVKMALSGGDSLYYNVGFETFAVGTNVTTWTGSEDTTAARDVWNHVGEDPKPTAGNTVQVGTTSVAAGGAATLLNLTGQGARSIASIKLKVPGVTAPQRKVVTDDGRAHVGTSAFNLSIGSATSPVTLVRRLDFGIADQKAKVFVDGVYAGEWFDAGSNTADNWKDSSFALPLSATSGKSSIHVTVQFVSSAADWNEFRYQAVVNGNAVDTLDVGNAASESAHQYSIIDARWSGVRTFTYPASGDTTAAARATLNNTRLRITFDGQPTPAVDAPLGMFFGMGQFGPANVRALPIGIDDNDFLYCYFPMPFLSQARVELVNDNGAALNGVSYEIQHKAFTGNFADVGYFKTALNTAGTVTGQDVQILKASGAGKFLGVTESMQGETNRWFLEGDERIYVDGNRTPVIHGTGTEDFYDGAWYFQEGPYTRPLSGNSVHNVETTASGQVDETVAYRFFLQNAVPFRDGIHVSIEHGATNDVLPNVATLAYYYQSASPRAVLTDLIDAGNTDAADPTSEPAHDYAITNQSWTGKQTFTFEGDDDDMQMTDEGRAHKGSSEFNLKLNASNVGMILCRTLDAGIADSRANVFVDGAFVGTWYRAGANGTHRWAEDDFLIPAAFTAGKSQVRVKISFVSAEIDWNEFEYRAFSLLPNDSTPPTVTNAVFDRSTGHAVAIDFSESLAAVPESTGLSVRNLTTGATLPASAFTATSPSAGKLNVRFNSILADGNYRLTLAAGSVADTAGNAMASPYTFDFFVLAGDVNGDRVVNFSDLVIVAQNYNQTGRTFAQGNIDYSSDGKVDFNDLVLLAQRYNTTLRSPAANAAVGTVSAPTATKRKSAAAEVL